MVVRLDRAKFVWAWFPLWLLSDWRCGDWGDVWLLILSLQWAVSATFHLFCPLGYSILTSVRQLGRSLCSTKSWRFFTCFLCWRWCSSAKWGATVRNRLSPQMAELLFKLMKRISILTPSAVVQKYVLKKKLFKHNIMWNIVNGFFLVNFCYIGRQTYVCTYCCLQSSEENVIRIFHTVYWVSFA